MRTTNTIQLTAAARPPGGTHDHETHTRRFNSARAVTTGQSSRVTHQPDGAATRHDACEVRVRPHVAQQREADEKCKNCAEENDKGCRGPTPCGCHNIPPPVRSTRAQATEQRNSKGCTGERQRNSKGCTGERAAQQQRVRGPGCAPARDSGSMPAAKACRCDSVVSASPCSTASRFQVMPTTARENARPINTKYASDSALQRQSRHATPAHRGTPSHDSLRCCTPQSTHPHCAPAKPTGTL